MEANGNIGVYVVGLMSGTSLDGIDAALIQIIDNDNGIKVNPIDYISIPFSVSLREKLLKLCTPEEATVTEISAMNMLLGELLAEAAKNVIQKAAIPKEDILLISSHGQTIFHQPNPVLYDGRKITSTLQIGDIGVIAERTGIMTIGDFRTRDMAAGGQGAPLVPYVDYLLFAEKEFGRVLVNIGGITNITILPKSCRESDVIAYDTGPGNMMIDAFTFWATNGAQSYDKDGALAAKGKVNQVWLEQLLKHSYFTLMPPKSTGRELFGIDYARRLWDQAEIIGMDDLDKIATITELTAKSLALEIESHQTLASLKEVLISGGGRHNQTLVDRIDYHLSRVGLKVMGVEAYGMTADAKEAIIFALLGYQCYMQRTNNLPTATGAKRKVVMGKIAW